MQLWLLEEAKHNICFWTIKLYIYPNFVLKYKEENSAPYLPLSIWDRHP